MECKCCFKLQVSMIVRVKVGVFEFFEGSLIDNHMLSCDSKWDEVGCGRSD